MDIEEKKALLEKLRARKIAEQDSSLDNFVPNPIQKAFLLSPAKVRILAGANRSGKTEVSAVDIVIQATGLEPKSLEGLYPKKFIRQGGYWVSSTRYPVSRDVAKPKIDRYLPKRYRDRFNKSDFIHYLKDGSQIGFKSMDAGRDAYAGDSRFQIWMDEEHNEDVYHEAYMRTIDCEGRIVMSFTPVEGLTWAYEKLYKKAKVRYVSKNKHGIKEEAGVLHTVEEIKLLRDREVVPIPNTDPDADENIEVFQMSIYDNPYLPDVEIQNAERDNLADIALYQARMLGHFTKITGRQVFSVPLLIEGKAGCSGKFERGEIEQGRFVKQKDGRLVTFQRKKDGAHYVIGADIAEGGEDGDYSCAQIINHVTKEQVAVWHGHVSPEQFARILIQLGRYYNSAILAPERNIYGSGVVTLIRDQRYPALYSGDNDDLYVDARSEKYKYGWRTDANSKPNMVNKMAQFLTEKAIRINDPNTWEELLTFVYHKEKKMGALKGCHDDRAMALMIALEVASTRRPRVRGISRPRGRDRASDPHTGY